MVANLDFVESIFGNGDNPDLAENDAALDPEHWTGTTGCVILAPHLIKLKKKVRFFGWFRDLGSPPTSSSSRRRKLGTKIHASSSRFMRRRGGILASLEFYAMYRTRLPKP